MFSEVDREIEYVRSVVSARFPVYETKVTPEAVQFLVTVDPATMDAKFEELRLELVPKNYIPFLARQGGEYALLVQRRAEQRFLGRHVNLILLLITIATTTWAGAVNWAGYDNIDWLSLDAFAKGSLFFTLPLLGILGIHEMGHYVMAKRYKVHASLPFFIPAPVTLLGTFGAMISMRDPIPNRRALMDIGAAGPVLGLLAAIPITLLGLFFMSTDPRPAPPNMGGGVVVDLPFLYQVLAAFVPIPQDAILHPTAFAGWVGLFVTALNLLPAGQLDGGHVARAILGDRAQTLSYVAIATMLVLGLFYTPWLIIAVFILVMGARHPPPLNDLTKLDVKRHALGAAAAAVLLLSFTAIPINIIPPDVGLQFEDVAAPGVALLILPANVTDGSTTTISFRAVNDGNVRTRVDLSLAGIPEPVGLNASFESVTILGNPVNASNRTATFFLNSSEVAIITIFVNATNYALVPPAEGDPWPFDVRARAEAEGLEAIQEILTIQLRVVP